MATIPDPPKPRNPAAANTPRFLWPTPAKANLVFWVEKEGRQAANKLWTLGEAWPDAVTYPDHKLIYVSPQDETGWSRWFYASDRVTEDDYNWEFTQANIGGQTFDAVRRSYLVPRTSWAEATPAAGAAMPRDPSNKFPEGYVLSGRRQQRTGDDMFDGLYVVEVRDYVKKVDITSLGVDDLNGKVRTSTDTLYYATETVSGGKDAATIFADPTDTFWGLQDDGTQNSGKQLSEDWYLVTNEVVVAGTFAGGVVSVDSYTTNERYYWPPVLANWEFMDWERRDGGVDIYPRYDFERDGYNGPTKVVITRTWSKTAQTPAEINPMLPTPVTYSCPFFRLAIPACLHNSVSPQCDIGSNDPIYGLNFGSTRTVVRTNYLVWPDTITGVDSQVPFRGGFLRTAKVYHKPPDTNV